MTDAASMEWGNLFHQLMQTLMEGVAIADKHGNLVYANRTLEQLLGYEPGEMIGRHWSTLFPARERRWIRSVQVQTPDAAAGRQELRLLCKDGTAFPALASRCSLSDGDDGRIILLTFADLRESRHLEAQVQEMARPAWMGHHLAGVVHELSNSLTIVSLQAQVLSKKDPLPPSSRESLDMIRDQTGRMLQMIESLRATADPYQIHLESTDVNALLEQTLALQRQTLQLEGIQVITDMDASLPAAGADPYRLQQVFVNLVNNAREAIAATQRSGTLLVATWVVAGDDGEMPRIRIRFADSGPGIPPEAMPYIFEPFFTTKAGKSMGLGLAICRQIVQKHGGQIWAEHNAMGGATLVVELPAGTMPRPEAEHVPASSALHHATVAPDASAGNPHILVVDTEPAVAHSVGHILWQAGYRVSSATDAQQALVVLEQNQIDLMIADATARQMGGTQFWQTVLKRQPRLEGRIILTGEDRNPPHRRSLPADCSEIWVLKPIQPEQLLHVIQTTLHRQPVTSSEPG